jgi:U3 small nucleolar RNA-associated protein 12
VEENNEEMVDTKTMINRDENTDSTILSDEIELIDTIRCGERVKGFAFNPLTPIPFKKTNESNGLSESFVVVKALVGLSSNAIEIYGITLPFVLEKNLAVLDEKHKSKEIIPISSKLSVIDLQGHRTDVRAVCLSGDGMILGTCSSEGVKVFYIFKILI